MRSDRLLQVTFAISLLTHGAILLQAPSLNPFSPVQKKQKIEVHYIKENLRAKSLPKASPGPDLQTSFPKPEPFLKLDSKVVTGTKTPPPYIEQNNASKTERLPPNRTLGFPKPTFAAPPLMAIKKKISLPPIEMAKINNPSYINYYQIVREKIRRSAYQNYTHNETGEVYISFIISCDGYIKDARLVEEKTTAGEYLKEIALRSVKNASPFPDFPKELDYLQLSFNIIISFEIE
ncbi:MAG: hypothetical protein PHP73_02940 [Candidatus Omnitrophica bacterium]|nr:hypothetical protein [Candidatus Omnitrophota bacterium]